MLIPNNPSLLSPLNRDRILLASRRGSVLNLVLIAVLTVVLLGVGTWLFIGTAGPSALDEPLTAKVVRGTFTKEVLDQGEIQSSENFEIRCQVKSRYGSRGVTVKNVVEEGTKVKGGDFLIQLRSDEIEENFENQTIEVNNAKDALTAALNNLESEQVAKLEYEKGTYIESLELINNQISQAETDRDKARDYLEFSKKLQAKGFITGTELANDEAELQRRERDLKSAMRSKMVLEKYSYKKNIKDFDSRIAIAQSKYDAAKNNLAIEKKQLAEIKEQLDACTISVPEGQSGTVVYANIFSRRGNSEFVLEEGATVREGQVLIRLPNPNKMQVRATVNESRVTSIEEDMDVKISVDALNGRELVGTVTKVNQYAEPEGWGGGGVRKYAVYVKIINPIPDIKPGMNASVLVEVERIESTLLVPIQGVYGYRGKTFCLVKRNDQWETVEVAVGSNNDTNVVIESGLEEGEEVALNPAGFKHLLNLPDIEEPEESASDRRDAKKKRDYSKKKKKPQSKSKNSPSKGIDNPNQNQPSNKTKTGAETKSDLKTKPAGKSKPDPKSGSSTERKSGPNSETARNSKKPDVKKA